MMNAAAVFDLDRELTGPAGDPNTSFAAADIAKNQIIIFIVNIQLKLGVAIAAKLHVCLFAAVEDNGINIRCIRCNSATANEGTSTGSGETQRGDQGSDCDESDEGDLFHGICSFQVVFAFPCCFCQY